MDDRELKILNKIEEDTKDIIVPESLQPEQVEKLLEKQTKKINRRGHWEKGLVAASILLLCGTVYGMSRNRGYAVPEEAAAEVTEEMAAETEVLKGFATASGYEDIYAYVDAYWKAVEKQNKEIWLANGAVEEAAVEDMAVATGAAPMEKSAASHSETNVRQEGVDEADVVKTDGEYIYALQDEGDAIAIIKAEDGTMNQVGMIEMDEEVYIREFYITGDKLLYVASKYADDYNAVMPRAKQSFSTESVMAVTLDISDVSEPVELGRVSQSGTYSGSRMTGGYLYLFSESYMHGGGDAGRPETFVPAVNEELLKADSIFLPITDDAYIYEILTSVNLSEPSEVYDSKAVFTKGGQVYVSDENIYWYETEWIDSTSTTIRKLSYKDGEIQAVASEKIGGYINDSFSIDEYDGYLRVVTTEGDTNNVFVMDEELEVVGEIEDIAKDERVYSARFMGDIGYFVTFRETDPLFSVDFSEPEKPEIIGELKIPGFSEYLHPYEEGKLLGIGMDADEETGVTSGVKVSMFDISDPTDVKETDSYIMENVYSADVFWDYKAVLVDAEKNIIGFSAYENEENYYVFSYDDSAGFHKEMEERVNGSSYQATRGIYIGNILYVVKGNIIESYNMLGYEKIDDIII